jgi:very-short-patch-repair endonuclease
LDGEPHFAANVDEYEVERTRYLEGQGIRVMRFENRAIHHDIEFVLETIRENLRETIPPN